MSRIAIIDEEEEDNQDVFSYKIILLGGTTVGKTSLIIRFWDSKFNESCASNNKSG